MGQKFAAYDSDGAIAAFYDSDDSPVPDDVQDVIEITDEEWYACLSTPGYTVADGALVPPVPPTAAELTARALVESAQSALAAGLTLVSTGSPAINATYAIDQLSQMDVIAIETGLNAGTGFPGGAATFNYPDIAGALHPFSETSFKDFAAAMRTYVYALRSVIAGSASKLPVASTTIP
jgi:hypothetical protein